jgi:hypothetical protein
LWPLDIALRRVSMGRRELAGARAWVGGLGQRRHRRAARSATAKGLLAARDRAGSAARLALLEHRSDPDAALAPPDKAGAPVPRPDDPVAPRPAATSAPTGPAAVPPATDTIDRLHQAKRRARDR